MSLIHLHPGRLNPRVHYRSPFFDESAARADLDRVAQRDAEVARASRCSFYRTALGLSVDQARIFGMIVDAGASGAPRKTIADVLGHMNGGDCWQFMSALRERLARRGVEMMSRALPGSGRPCAYVLTEAGRDRLDRIFVEADRPAPVVTVRPETKEESLARLFVLTGQQVAVLLALHGAGCRGLDTQGLREATGIAKLHAPITRLELRLCKAGWGLERSATRSRYRLPDALRAEISRILAGDDPAD